MGRVPPEGKGEDREAWEEGGEMMSDGKGGDSTREAKHGEERKRARGPVFVPLRTSVPPPHLAYLPSLSSSRTISKIEEVYNKGGETEWVVQSVVSIPPFSLPVLSPVSHHQY